MIWFDPKSGNTLGDGTQGNNSMGGNFMVDHSMDDEGFKKVALDDASGSSQHCVFLIRSMGVVWMPI